MAKAQLSSYTKIISMFFSNTVTRQICLFFLFTAVLLFSCQTEEKEIADFILINGEITTLDKANTTAEAIAVKGDRLFKIGSNQEIQALAGDKTKTIDLKGNFVMPGIIEGHGHFSRLGSSLMNLNFLRSKSWQSIARLIDKF